MEYRATRKNKNFYVENGQKPSANSNQFVEKKGVTKPLVSEMSKNRGDDGSCYF